MPPTTLVCISSDVPGEDIDNITRQCPSLPNYELWDTVKESARPGYWERMISLCRDKKIKEIYCNRLISLGRGSITNMLNLLASLWRDGGIKIYILNCENFSPADTLITLWLWEKEVKSLAQSASLARARAAGSRVGRPPKEIDGARIRQLAAMGESSRGIAERLGISHTTVLRKLAPAEAPSKQVVKPLPTT
jgi:DNA invertase Pin-like site-specific DNA recombinase